MTKSLSLFRKIVKKDGSTSEKQTAYNVLSKKISRGIRTGIELVVTSGALVGGLYLGVTAFHTSYEKLEARRMRDAFYLAERPEEALERACEYALLSTKDQDLSEQAREHICDNGAKVFIQEKLTEDATSTNQPLEKLLKAYTARKDFPFHFAAEQALGIYSEMITFLDQQPRAPTAEIPLGKEEPIAHPIEQSRAMISGTETEFVKLAPTPNGYFVATTIVTLPFVIEHSDVVYADDQLKKELHFYFIKPEQKGVIEIKQSYDQRETTISELSSVASVAVADVHPNPGKETIFQNKAGTILITDAAGTPLAKIAESREITKMDIVDIDLDGKLELVVSSAADGGWHQERINIYDFFERRDLSSLLMKTLLLEDREIANVSFFRSDTEAQYLSAVSPLYRHQYGNLAAVGVFVVKGKTITYTDHSCDQVIEGGVERESVVDEDSAIINLNQQSTDHRCVFIRGEQKSRVFPFFSTTLASIEQGNLYVQELHFTATPDNCLYFSEQRTLLTMRGKSFLFYSIESGREYTIPVRRGEQLKYAPELGNNGTIFVTNPDSLLGYDGSLLELVPYLERKRDNRPIGK